MANQPPVRPWFRLASLRPLPAAPPPAPAPAPPPEAQPPAPAPAPAQAPAPAPVTRPIMSLPTFRTSSAPSSPQTRTVQPPAPAPLPAPAPEPIAPRAAERPSVPSSPARKVPSPPPVQKAAISVPSSPASDKTSTINNITQSPKTIRPAVQAPMESPKARPSAAPPSPLVLPPPSQPEPPRIPAEAEPKTVVMQKTIEKPKQRSNGVGDEKGKMSHQEKSLKEGKKTEECGGFRVITIAGENRGAFMEVIQSGQKGQKKSMTKEDSESGKSSEEGEAKKKKKGRGRSTASFPMTAFVNSNVQSVNNSLLYNASCSHHDPGVRFSLSKKPVGDGLHVKEQSN